MSMKTLIAKIFIGTYKLEYKLNPAVKNQAKNVKRVWNNTNYKDFGLERIARLFLVSIQFFFPALYIRDLTGRMGLLSRKLGVEVYVIMKLLFPILMFTFKLTDNIVIYFVTLYFLVETFIYLLSLIFLSDIYARPITYKRSFLLLLINFVEIGLDYAVLYSYFNSHTIGFFKGEVHSAIDIIYFSFVSLSTLGFGDVTVANDTGKIIVLAQILTFLLFVGLFLNFYASKIQDVTYFNSTNKPRWDNDIKK